MNNKCCVEVGGKKAGLLNFSPSDCPYQAREPWQYGTKVSQIIDTVITNQISA
jgi:hypothetical protein